MIHLYISVVGGSSNHRSSKLASSPSLHYVPTTTSFSGYETSNFKTRLTVSCGRNDTSQRTRPFLPTTSWFASGSPAPSHRATTPGATWSVLSAFRSRAFPMPCNFSVLVWDIVLCKPDGSPPGGGERAGLSSLISTCSSCETGIRSTTLML